MADTGGAPALAEGAGVLEQIQALEDAGRFTDAIDVATEANRRQPDPRLEFRLTRLRHAAFPTLALAGGLDAWPPAVPPSAPGLDESTPIPVVAPEDLSVAALRRGVLGCGSLLAPGLLDQAQVELLIAGIDQAMGSKDPEAERPGPPWHQPLPLPPDQAPLMRRGWIGGGGGALTVDSPRMLFTLLEIFEELGLHDLATGYLGERPALSANKWTLRRVPPDAVGSWHQDGAFLGDGIRALNIWISLSHCGVDAPGMDLLPRRLDHVVETGTGGSYFDWDVGPETVAKLAVDTPVVRPQFAPGDVLFFDDLFLHRTAVTPEMTKERYAIESWCFAPSAYPPRQVPAVW
ncbi:MAG: hypothetical protein JWM05_1601 [Acidimicrobiales bacterium]|nr:hypothetical protein [Acidimicrobiales bacterium]